MDEKNNKIKMRLPIIFAVVPLVLFLIEILLIVFSAVYGLFNWEASIIPGLLAIIGMFFTPITSFVFEIIGFIVSIKRKLKLFIIIYIIEIALTIVSCIVYAFVMKVWFLLI